MEQLGDPAAHLPAGGGRGDCARDADAHPQRGVHAEVHTGARKPRLPCGQPGQDRADQRDPAHPQRAGRAPAAPALHAVLLLVPQEPVSPRREQGQDCSRQRLQARRAGAQEQPWAQRHRGRGLPDARQAVVGQRGPPEQDHGGGGHRGHRGGDEDAPLSHQREPAGGACARGPCVEQLGGAAAGGAVWGHPGDDSRYEPLRRQRGVPAEVRPRPRQLQLP
mmetsp:Transcript_37844/g.96766  ORF Transcript_37844/g.96766 Transcript_37844/m.96766 type:complete len:221 (-) Transcript_37844:787-1449(-)